MTINGEVARSLGNRSWVLGGSLLLASVVVGAVTQPSGSLLPLLGTVLSSAALVIFALGFRGAGGVAAGQRGGTIALCALAGWTAFGAFFARAFSSVIETSPPALGYINDIICVALATVAVVAVGRSSALPRPWNWAPAAVLASWIVLWLLEQMLRVAVVTSPALGYAVTTLDGLIHLGGPVFLGAAAIAIGNRSVEVSGTYQGPVDANALVELLDSVVADAESAEALVDRLDAERRPTASDAREGQRLRFTFVNAERALAEFDLPPQEQAQLDEVQRVVAYYQHMIKHGMDLGFSANLAESPSLRGEVPSRRHLTDLIALRDSLNSALTQPGARHNA